MANLKKIRVGIAGLDHFFAGLAAVGEIAKDPQAELVIIAHRDRDRAKQTTAQLQAKWATDYAAVLNEDIDLLITACPTNRNAELVIAAAEKGVHPMTLAIAWVMRNPAITCPIIGARSVAQLQASLAAESFEMDDALMADVTALSRTPPPATDRLEEQRA